MYIERLYLRNFRNYEYLDVEYSKNINILHGMNGQGKTNVIEAIYMLALGKSFRGVKDCDLIRHDSDNYLIRGTFNEDITDSIQIEYNGKKEKYIKVNELYLRKFGHLMGAVLAVIFSPEDMLLVSEGPSERRRFIDIAISQIKPSYFFDLQKYNKILLQKNALLREINRKIYSGNKDALDVWNEHLAMTGEVIINERIYFCNELEKYASEHHYNISSETEVLNIAYDSQYKSYDELLEQMNLRKDKEIERESSIIGPHRDDLNITLNNDNLKKFGSQGQKRTVVLSLKMAEFCIIKERTGRAPILLMDDVYSELDKKRQEAVLNCVDANQVFITTNDPRNEDYSNSKRKLFLIKNGTLVL